MLSVYIETTIPSFYHSGRKSIQALAWRAQTRTWWDKYRSRYQLCTSDAVLIELRNAPSDRGVARIQLLDEARILAPNTEVEQLAAFYISEKLMPGTSGLDAVHVALASIYRVDFLLTWNCRHIANANKAAHLAALNRRRGLPVPMMVTPYTLIPEDNR